MRVNSVPRVYVNYIIDSALWKASMSDASVKLFLSCVSDEFREYRDALRHELTRLNVEVKIQEDFKDPGNDTLQMLETYIEQCAVVVHFVGALTGSLPSRASVAGLLARRPDFEPKLAGNGLARESMAGLTYTQWEAWLAIGFDKKLLIAAPAEGVARAREIAATTETRAAQAAHLARLKALDRYPLKPFTSAENLIFSILNCGAVFDALLDARKMPGWQRRSNLPFHSLGSRFVGRDKTVDALRAALVSKKDAKLVVAALWGLPGIGKTRLAIEYAWAYKDKYSALLFVNAESEAALNANFASLAGASVLNLREGERPEYDAKIPAVETWLESNSTWLMIVDGVDDNEAVAAVTQLLPRLAGGHVVVTARASNFPTSIQKFEIDVLAEDAGTQFLLERTAGDRDAAKDDLANARVLARQLGGLALGLEQAGAYIATEHISFSHYLKLWNEAHEKVLRWCNRTLMAYDKSLATTWVASVAHLKPQSRRLLRRLAFLAPDPDAIPNSLLEIRVSGDTAHFNAYKARADLFSYSLIQWAKAEDGVSSGFKVHRLLQDFVYGNMSTVRKSKARDDALEWIDAAFDDHDPYDQQDRRLLDTLEPHAIALARSAPQNREMAEPRRLFEKLAEMAYAKIQLYDY